MDLPLTYAGVVYDRTRALYDGDVRVEGVELRYLRTGVEELFWRQGRYAEFDAAEFSLGAYLAGVEDPDRPFDAIPVFPSRAFRHSAVYVRADSPFHEPADLAGARIGTPEWSMTASLWMRGILGDHYGLDLTGIRWRTGGLEQAGRQEKSRVRPPERYSVEPLAAGATLTGELVAGGLDAVITARPPRRYLAGDGSLRRLFSDPKAEEQRFVLGGVVRALFEITVQSTDDLGLYFLNSSSDGLSALSEFIVYASDGSVTAADNEMFGVEVVPEPASMIALGVGIAALARKRRKA